MSRTRDPNSYSLDRDDSLKVAARASKIMDGRKPPMTKADLAKHLDMHATHAANLFSDKKDARRWQRWHVVGTAKALGITEAALLEGTKQQVPMGDYPASDPVVLQVREATGDAVTSDGPPSIYPEVERYIGERDDELSRKEKRRLRAVRFGLEPGDVIDAVILDSLVEGFRRSKPRPGTR